MSIFKAYGHLLKENAHSADNMKNIHTLLTNCKQSNDIPTLIKNISIYIQTVMTTLDTDIIYIHDAIIDLSKSNDDEKYLHAIIFELDDPDDDTNIRIALNTKEGVEADDGSACIFLPLNSFTNRDFLIQMVDIVFKQYIK